VYTVVKLYVTLLKFSDRVPGILLSNTSIGKKISEV